MRPSHVELSASGICGQTANPLRTVLPRRGQTPTSLAPGRLCRVPASYVVEHSPQRAEALQCSRSSLLDSRQHCLLERPRLSRNSYEQSKQGKSWQNRGGDRPRGRCKSKGKVSAVPKGQCIGRWECMIQDFGPSDCNPVRLRMRVPQVVPSLLPPDLLCLILSPCSPKYWTPTN